MLLNALVPRIATLMASRGGVVLWVLELETAMSAAAARLHQQGDREGEGEGCSSAVAAVMDVWTANSGESDPEEALLRFLESTFVSGEGGESSARQLLTGRILGVILRCGGSLSVLQDTRARILRCVSALSAGSLLALMKSGPLSR